MKKFKQLVLLFLVASVTLVSCNKNDDNEEEVPVATIEGKWEYTQETNDAGQLVAYEHTAGCNKDYVEIIAGGTIKDVSFYKNSTGNCVEDSFTANWSRNGNVITVTSNGISSTAEIMELTNTTLKVKTVDGSDTYITVHTRR